MSTKGCQGSQWSDAQALGRTLALDLCFPVFKHLSHFLLLTLPRLRGRSVETLPLPQVHRRTRTGLEGACPTALGRANRLQLGSWQPSPSRMVI